MGWPVLLGAAGVSGSSSAFNFFLGFWVLPFDRVFCLSPVDCLTVCFGVLLAAGFTGGGVFAPEFDEGLSLEILLFPFMGLLAFSSLFFAFLAFLTSALAVLELLAGFPNLWSCFGSVVVVLDEPEDPDATEGMTSPWASYICSSVSS